MRLISFCLLVLLTPILAAETPTTWPQWRGPTRDCKVIGGPAWPEKLQAENLTKLWSVELGPGYPGPIVAEDRVFVAETKDRKFEVVRALDRKTGKQLWETQWEGAMTVPFFAWANGSWIRSTPAYDGESLYVAGMRDVLYCLDAKTGKVTWKVDFRERFKTPLPDFGCVCSPLLEGDALYMQAGGSFVKLNKKTGETIWRTLEDGGGMYGSAFSSPTLATIQSKPQVLVQTRKQLTGVDPKDGKVLWSQEIPAFRGMNILTPMTFGDAVFTSAHTARSYLYEITRGDEGMKTKEAWTTKDQAYMTSPVIIDGHAYLLKRGRTDKRQPMICIDLLKGETKWTSEQDFGEYCSMAVQGDRILALDNNGKLSLIKASPAKFELLGQAKVSEEQTWGHIAVCGDEIFVRELNGIVAYRWKK
jgi:outer membrane protein assembly factor BamB